MDHTQPYPDDYVQGILNSVKTIAMVGASPNEARASNDVLRVLLDAGYDVIPVNPREGLGDIHGQKVFPSLAAINRPVDMVDVFRRSEELLGVTRDAIAIKAQVLWAQIGVVDHDAAALAEQAGLQVVMDRCPKIELFRRA